MCDLEYGMLVASPPLVLDIWEWSIHSLLSFLDAVFCIRDDVLGIWQNVFSYKYLGLNTKNQIQIFGTLDDKFGIWHMCDLECGMTAVSWSAHLWTLNTPLPKVTPATTAKLLSTFFRNQIFTVIEDSFLNTGIVWFSCQWCNYDNEHDENFNFKNIGENWQQQTAMIQQLHLQF